MSDITPADGQPEGGSPEDELLARLHMQWEQEEREAKAIVKSLCDRLREQGIEQVRIAYDGCGDSGVIDGVTATGKDGEEIELGGPLLETLTDAACRLLPGGWEINEGSFGELVLDVPAVRLEREHSWRIESTEDDEHEIEL